MAFQYKNLVHDILCAFCTVPESHKWAINKRTLEGVYKEGTLSVHKPDYCG